MPGRTRSVKVVAAILFRQTLLLDEPDDTRGLLGPPGGNRGRLLSRAEAVPQTVPALYPLYGPAAAWPYRLPRIGFSQIAHGVSARTLVRTPGRCHGASLPVGPLGGPGTGLPTWPQGGGPNFVAARSPLGSVDRVSVRCSGAGGEPNAARHRAAPMGPTRILGLCCVRISRGTRGPEFKSRRPDWN